MFIERDPWWTEPEPAQRNVKLVNSKKRVIKIEEDDDYELCPQTSQRMEDCWHHVITRSILGFLSIMALAGIITFTMYKMLYFPPVLVSRTELELNFTFDRNRHNKKPMN